MGEKNKLKNQRYMRIPRFTVIKEIAMFDTIFEEWK